MISSYPYLLKSVVLGDVELQTSVVMAPITRCQANEQHEPTDDMRQFYQDRANGALLIAEATLIRWDANAYPCTPGIYTPEQIEAWRRINHAVHEAGGKIFSQLWHAGMMGHRQYRKSPECPEGTLPLSCSAVKPLRKNVPRSQPLLAYDYPKAMDQEDFTIVLNAFTQAAIHAVHKAQFDGIELHASNGYLLDSFLHHSTNQRKDEYGGSHENRCRFVLQVVDSVVQAIGAKKVGIRISPVPLPSMQSLAEEEEDQETFKFLLKELNKRKIAYVHVCSDNDRQDRGLLGQKVSQFVRTFYEGIIIAGGGYDIESGEQALKNGEFNLIYYGRLFVANPDLLSKIRQGQSSSIRSFSAEMLQHPPKLKS